MVLNKRIALGLLFFAAIVAGSVIFSNRVFSYNDDITHPSLTDNVAKIYNANFDRKLSNEEIEWLKQGSIKEDLAPRWVNHFYNPQTGTGLGSMMNSKNWAQSPNYQGISDFTKSGGDQTWNKALYSYIHGNNQEAFFALGHVLHLLEDATVPAHTRIDAHPEGDPYEKWAVNKIGSSINFNVSPASVNDIDAAFDILAGYSSKNFLSKDTINTKNIENLEVDEEEVKLNNGTYKKYGFLTDYSGNKFKFVKIEKVANNRIYSIDDPVHSDYFSLLAPKAVSYGAGVVKLFFDEAENAKKEYENKSWLQKLRDNANQLLSGFTGISLSAGIGTDIAPSPTAAGQAAEDEAPEVAPLATPTPATVPLPSNTIVAREKIIAQLPADAVVAQEKTGGEIIEEEVPQDSVVPPEIIEEITPGQVNLPASGPSVFTSGGGAPMPSPSLSPSPSPTATSTATSTPDTTPPETTIIIKPESLASSTAAIFEFSSSENDSTFSCQLDNASSTDCSSPQEYSDLSEGNHIFKVIATDAAGNSNATSTEYSWIIDLAPEILISLADYNLMNIDFTVNWSSSSTDVSYYDAQYKIGEQGIWQDWAMATTTTSKHFRADYDNVAYFFRVHAIDSANQVSNWQEIQALISQKPIIFNEIMYDPGPGSDDYYEYVEIYNRSSISINLKDWKLSCGGSEHLLSADTIHDGVSTILPPGGFALIVDKVTSTTTRSIYDGSYYNVPDYSDTKLRLSIDSAQMGLNNNGMALTLKDEGGVIIDQVSYSGGWYAVEAGESLERVNYNNVYSDFVMAWNVSSPGGTPNAANSVMNLLAGSPIKDSTLISQNTIWTKTGSPYILYASNNGASPTVDVGSALTIEPGATVELLSKNYNSLYVKGTLKAVGTNDEPIFFTSGAETPQAGDWGTGIYFAPESLDSELSYVTFEYGGYRSPFNDNYPAVVVDGAKIEINNCFFNNIHGRGLALMDSDSLVMDSRFLNNGDAALYISGSSTPIIKSNDFQNPGNLGSGIRIVNQAKPRVESNDISGFLHAVWLESSYPNFSGNALSNNHFNGVSVSERAVFSKDTTWQQGIVYILRSDAGFQYPKVAVGAVLTIEPGAIIKPVYTLYTALEIDGTLIADGQASSTLINFTSFKDDSLGGDTNNDGSVSEPNPDTGEWKNIIFADGSQAILKFVKFSYGGYNRDTTSYLYYRGPVLVIDEGAAVTQENVTIE